jgi:hypothetical protein
MRDAVTCDCSERAKIAVREIMRVVHGATLKNARDAATALAKLTARKPTRLAAQCPRNVLLDRTRCSRPAARACVFSRQTCARILASMSAVV